MDNCRARDIAQLVQFLPSMQKTLAWIPSIIQMGMVVQAYNPSVWKIEAGGSNIQGHQSAT